jgi:periplasmic protein TonB
VIVDRRIVACIALSVVAHVAFARAMRALPRRADAAVKRTISIRVVSPPPPPEPPPEPARPQLAPTPRPVPLERARPRQAPQIAHEAVPRDVPPPEHPPSPSDTTGGPVFGVSMESTSQAGGGPSMPVGNPANPAQAHAGGGHETGGGGATEPVAAYEVTKMPLPQERCVGKYTEEAKQAAIEGTVVLDLVVGADGRVREVRVVSGLGHGLTEAAIAAARSCRFSPGERNDVPVPVRIREFKIRFLLQNDE